MFYPKHFRGLRVFDHPGNLSGPVPGLPGQGQVSCRPWKRFHLRGNPIWMDWSCGLDIAWGYPSVAANIQTHSYLLCLFRGKQHGPKWAIIIIMIIIYSFLCPLTATWSLNTLIYVSISVFVATVFLTLYCTIPACQRSFVHVFCICVSSLILKHVISWTLQS